MLFFTVNFLYSQLLASLPKPESSFKDQIVVITGSNTGLGLEAARHVVALDARLVILAVRNIEKGEKARKDILNTTGRSEDVVQVYELDLSRKKSVLGFATRIDQLERLDAVISNAGVLTANRWDIDEEMERTLAVNVLNNVLLGYLLIPKLRMTSKNISKTKGRLTFVGSDMQYAAHFSERHTEGRILDALNDQEKEKNNMGDRYPTSKLLILVAVRHLAAQFPVTQSHQVEWNPIINCSNPGFSTSEIVRDDLSSSFRLFFELMHKIFARTTEVGSRALVHGVDLKLTEDFHGKFLNNCRIARNPHILDTEDGQRGADKFMGELLEYLEGVKMDVTKE
ncbi:MAG: hypothetical protein Q9227_009117 [Pyrenula ochraceoflavens]